MGGGAGPVAGDAPGPEAGPVARARPDDDAINQVFVLFQLNYHNQFFKAYPNEEQLLQVKRLWKKALTGYSPQQIQDAADEVIKTSEYLPTLNFMLQCCERRLGRLGLPDARTAYLEACRAGSPKSAQRWSHPAVYLAGRDSDWFVLANNAEKVTWPLFRERYRDYCTEVMAGKKLEIPAPEALPEPTSQSVSKSEARAQLAKLKRILAG